MSTPTGDDPTPARSSNPAGATDATLILGDQSEGTRRLASAIDAGTLIEVPEPLPETSSWEWTYKPTLASWRSENRERQPAGSIVVCAWPRALERVPLVERPELDWRSMEVELARWTTALQLAGELCRGGGAIVLVTELPCALDAAGLVPLVGLSQGLIAFARSIAAAEGSRNVRANCVTTQLWSTPPELAGSAPFLPSYPGSIEREVAGAVRMLLSPDSSGVSGCVVPADGGRTW